MTDNEVIQKLVTTSGRINSNISRNLPNDIKQYLEQRFDNITSWKEALYNSVTWCLENQNYLHENNKERQLEFLKNSKNKLEKL